MEVERVGEDVDEAEEEVEKNNTPEGEVGVDEEDKSRETH